MLCDSGQRVDPLPYFEPDEKLSNFVNCTVHNHIVCIVGVVQRDAAPVNPAVELAWGLEKLPLFFTVDKATHYGLDRDERFQAVDQFEWKYVNRLELS